MQLVSELIRFCFQNLDIILGGVLPILAILGVMGWLGIKLDATTMMIGAMLVVLVFMTVAMLVQRYLLSFVAVRIDSSTLDFITRKLLALPMTYFNTRRAGDIQTRLLGMAQVREFLTQYGVTGITASTQLLAALALMFAYNTTLALVFVSLAPFYALLVAISRRRLKPIFNDLKEAQGRYRRFV